MLALALKSPAFGARGRERAWRAVIAQPELVCPRAYQLIRLDRNNRLQFHIKVKLAGSLRLNLLT